MSFAEEFGHDIPPDDYYPTSSGRRRSGNYSNFVDYNRRTEVLFREIVCETDKAYLFKCKEGKTWVPKSRIFSVSLDNLRFYVPYWLYCKLEYIKE